MSLLTAQEPANPNDSFEIEPPLLVPPEELAGNADDSAAAAPDLAKLTRELERAKKSVVSTARLVKVGALAKVDGEKRTLDVIRLESLVADARLLAARELVTQQQTQLAAGQSTAVELAAAQSALTEASATAESAQQRYRRAQLEAAELALRRQRRLRAVGAARSSDVTRAAEKLARLQSAEPVTP